MEGFITVNGSAVDIICVLLNLFFASSRHWW